ncbi:MAG: rod shape-determining protein MreC [Desulfobulbus sp.]|nr:MAG: rod shape-determining protein MreC [Desulfobulbus sp.]
MRKKTTRTRGSRNRTFRLVLLGGVVLTVGLVFLVFIFGNQESGPMHKLLFETAGPVQKFVASTTGSLQSIKKNYIDLLTVRGERNKLVKELQECRAAAYQNREAVATNARLRKLLDFKNTIDLPTVSAQIVGKDPSLWFRSVVVDRGSTDGVLKGMPVVTGDGIVGQVYSTSPHFAKVLLSIAPSSALDVLLQESRERGILKGTGKNTYRLEYVLKTIEVAEGDHVVTAGYGGLFPTGVPVGVVTRVEKKRRGMFLDIEVTPAVDFDTLEDLLIIEQEKQVVE